MNETDEEAATTAESASTAGGGWFRGPRLILLAALLIAVAAVGISVFRSQSDGGDDTPSLASQAGQSEAPSVDQVIADLEARLQENPDDAEGWRLLGWSYFETQRFAESATAMRRAVSLDPDNAEYHSMLGEALVMASEEANIPADARKAFAEAVRIDPKDARARYFLAAAKDLDGKHEEAIEDWFALLADTPEDAPYAGDIRDVIRNVGKERGIDVEKRLASAKFAPPAATGPATDGGEVAAAAIPGPSREQMQAAGSLPQGQQEAMIRGMVDGLASRLALNPDDADGWIMLMRSRVQLGEMGKAQQAYRDAQAAFRTNDKQTRRIREAALALGVPGA